MALLEKNFTKRSNEAYSREITYVDKLPSGATITGVTASAVDLLDNSNASVLGSSGYTDYTALIPVQAGTDGHDYLITFVVTLSNGNLISDQMIMKVRDTPI